MKIHPRKFVTQEATLDLKKACMEVVNKHDLTEAESLKVINEALSEEMGSIVEYALRQERHGNTKTKSGVAK